MSTKEEIEFPVRFEDLPGFSGRFTVDEAEVWSGNNIPHDIDSRLEDLSESSEQSQDDINFLYSAIHAVADLSDAQRRLLNEALYNRAHQMLETCQDDPQSATIEDKAGASKAFYLLAHYCTLMERVFKATPTDASVSTTAAKKKKTKASSTSYIWPEWRFTCLNLFHKLLDGDARALFAMGIMPENFVMLFWKYTLQLLEEKPAGMSGVGTAEQASKKLCIAVLLLACKHVSAGASTGVTVLMTGLLDSACSQEHMAAPIAEICRSSGVGSALVSELMSEVARLNMTELSKGNGSGARNIGCFLIAVASVYPEMIALYLPLIMHHMDSDVYQIRCAIITAMGSTIAFIHQQCQAEMAKEQSSPTGESVGEGNEDSDDVGSGKFNMRQFMRLRDDMVDMLIERTHDVSAYARAAVLKVWISLVEAEALPVVRFGSVAEVALDRLKDKVASVRKSATQLLTAQLEFNPFSGSLNVAHFVTLRAELERRIKERMELLAEEVQATTEKDENKSAVRVKKEKGEADDDEEEEELFGDEEPENTDLAVMFQEDAEIVAMTAELSKCVSCLELLQSVHTAVPKIGAMLSSKTTSDVLEALRFFTRTMNFGIKGSAAFLHQTFSSIWHQEESIQLECLQTFFHVYVSDGGEGSGSSLLPSNEIAFNLVQLALRCSLAELTSVEKLIGEIFVRAKDSGNSGATVAQQAVFKKFSKQAPAVIQALWQMATISSRSNQQGAAADQEKVPLRGPLMVLKMIASSVDVAKLSNQVFPTAKVKVLCKLALENVQSVDTPSAMDDIRVAAICLQACSSFVEASQCSDDELQAVLISAAERLALVVCDKFQKFDNEEMTRAWFAMCEEAVSAVFRLHSTPDVFLGKMIMSTYTSWAAATSSEALDIVIKTRLARFMFLCGQGALSSLLYTEKIANSAKKSLEAKSKSKREEDKAKKDATGEEVSEVDDMEEEMGLTAMADAEHEREFNKVVEVELVANPGNLLGSFHPFIAFVVANGSGEFSDPLVREAAVLALCRYMSVSSVLCEEYLALLFTVLERETNAAIRTSIVIATGDLSFRFPNAVEPWTARMYDRLSDECLLVRYNTLMVLTHLILNDMIKVKGQVSAVVMCLNDPSEDVCGLARLFFTELSKRSNNPVYNLLGDVISTLSRDKTAPVLNESEATVTPSEEVVKVALIADSNTREHRELTPVEFNTTMHFLLSFVTKDKQADSLLERLLVRMAAAVSIKQRRNLAFCISELPITDKGVKRMTELLRQMKDCLFDKDIVEYLKQVVAKAKKTTGKASAGCEVKEAATEFEDFVKSVVEENLEDIDGENVLPQAANSLTSASGNHKKNKKAATTKKAPARKRKPKKVVEESSSEDESEESDCELSEEEQDDDDVAVTKQKNAASASTKRGLRC
mmetsp:Transcript_3353/g.6087  ORF Transcript_3353/g.6087 Transcript_3353/m.6087 type:complete len:1404 (+) Transcript_3353:47-4258(+)